MNVLIIVCIGAFLSASPVLADTSSQMTSWFDAMEYANVTAPGVMQGQSAHYATLGGLSTRAPITQPFQFAEVQTPRWSAGCGGIDLYAGGFSMINADQFIENLEAIGQNASSLAFMLGIQVVSPQLSGQIEYINSISQKLNAVNMDSCQAATELVGGTLDYFGAVEGNCTVKRMNEFGEDWPTANNACKTGGQVKATENTGDNSNTVTFTKGNLTWFVLMQDPFFSTDLEFAEVIMNLLGTVIITDTSTDDESPRNIRVLDPALNQNGHTTQRGANIINAMLLGTDMQSELRYFRCNDRVASQNGCIDVSHDLQTVTPNWVGLKGRVREQMIDIISRIYQDQPLTDVQSGMITTTQIPLYNYLVSVAAYFPEGAFDTSNVTNEFVDLVAQDVMYRNLQGVIEGSRHALSLLPNNLGQSQEVQSLRVQIEKVLDGVSQLKNQNEMQATDFVEMHTRIQVYEKAVMSRLGTGLVQSVNWGQ